MGTKKGQAGLSQFPKPKASGIKNLESEFYEKGARNMKKHKLLAVVLALAMTLSLLPTAALAAGEAVAKIGDQTFATLTQAISVATDNEIITIIAEGSYTLPAFSEKKLTIKADENVAATIDVANAVALSDAEVTFENLIFDYYPNKDYVGLQHTKSLTYNNCIINGQAFLYATTETFNQCTFNQESSGAYNVWTYGGQNVTFNQCTFNSAGKSVLIYNEGYNGSTVDFVSCTLKASTPVEGKAAIEIDSSLLKDSKTFVVNIDGQTTSTGFAVGSVSGNKLWNEKKNCKSATVTVSGEQVWPMKVAEIVGGGKYETLAAAIDAAKSGDTVKLLKDASGNGIQINTSEKSIIIDLGGYTYTVDGETVGSAGTETNGFQLLKGGSLTIQNGTLATTKASIMLQNYCNLTLKDVLVDASGSSACGYALSNNCGNVRIIGKTSIKAADGEVAFDLYYWPTNGYTDGVNVTVNTTGTITGKIEYDSDDKAGSAEAMHDKCRLSIQSGTFNGSISTYNCNENPNISITGGTFSNDPSAYVASGYAAVKTGESEWKVGKTYSATFNVTPSDATVEVKCGDVTVNGEPTAPKNYSGLNTVNTYTYTVSRSGYVTKTGTITPPVADQAADITVALDPVYYGGGSSSSSSSSSGSTTTTEKNPDGSTTTTVTDKKTGTVTETTKEKDGTTTTVETKKDGTVTETVKTAEGVTGTVVTDKNGDVTEVKSTVSSTAAKEAAKTGEAVTLPVEVPAVKTTEEAPALQVTVPKSADSVKVEIPVEKVTPGTVAVIVNADGTEKIVSTSVVTENGVALTLDGSATVKIIDNSKDFIDVPENNVFYNEISSLSAREIMVGKTDDIFDLHNSVTLNQIANVAGRITGAVDVKDFNAGVSWGADNGLKTGGVAATRGDVLKALYIAAGSPAVEDTSILSIFNDSSAIPADMAAIAAWAAQNGILKGGLDGNASLGVNVTRGQACALAGRTMGTLD